MFYFTTFRRILRSAPHLGILCAYFIFCVSRENEIKQNWIELFPRRTPLKWSYVNIGCYFIVFVCVCVFVVPWTPHYVDPLTGCWLKNKTKASSRFRCEAAASSFRVFSYGTSWNFHVCNFLDLVIRVIIVLLRVIECLWRVGGCFSFFFHISFFSALFVAVWPRLEVTQ